METQKPAHQWQTPILLLVIEIWFINSFIHFLDIILLGSMLNPGDGEIKDTEFFLIKASCKEDVIYDQG